MQRKKYGCDNHNRKVNFIRIIVKEPQYYGECVGHNIISNYYVYRHIMVVLSHFIFLPQHYYGDTNRLFYVLHYQSIWL